MRDDRRPSQAGFSLSSPAPWIEVTVMNLDWWEK